MNRPTTWLTLWKRIGKQPIRKTQGKYVKVCIIGQMWFCRLVYSHNGSDFYLVPIRLVENFKEQK